MSAPSGQPAFAGQTMSWDCSGGILELALHHDPCNELGTASLADLERFAAALEQHAPAAVIIHSRLASGFCAGADLRELYHRGRELPAEQRLPQVRDFLERIHRVFNTIDQAPATVIAAVGGLAFGGGFELALTADLIIADKTARFCFPELRLGLIPGFGGIPRLTRDIGNGVVRDLLLTGRSINAQKGQQCGLVSQVVAPGRALDIARRTAQQVVKFDAQTASAAKRFIKPLPRAQLQAEIDIFCTLFARPAVESGLRRFVESADPYPYLP